MREARRAAVIMLISVLLLAMLLPRPSSALPAAAAAATTVSSVPSSPPLINAHLLLAVRIVAAQSAPSSSAPRPIHLSLRLSCASPSARLTQNRDVELGPPSPWPSPSPYRGLGLGPLPGLWSAETNFAVEMARTPRQCRLSAFDKESCVRLGSKAFTLPGTGKVDREGWATADCMLSIRWGERCKDKICRLAQFFINTNPLIGSDDTTDALVHVELPVRLDRRQRGRPIDTLRTLSFLLRSASCGLNAFAAEADLRLRQFWRCISEMGVRAAAAASTEAAALASAAAALLHAVLTAGTAAGGTDDALRALTVVGVILLFVSLLPVSRRLLFAAFGSGAAGARCREAGATPAPGIQRTTDGQEPSQPQGPSQRTGQTFIPTDWHCVAHDRMGGAARMDECALVDLTHAVGAGGRGAAEATIGVVVGRLLNNSVRGVLLSYKGQ